MSKSEKEKKEITYKFFAAFCMYILHILVNCVFLISYFSWIGVVALFLINIAAFLVAMFRDDLKAKDNIPLSDRYMSLYVLDILLVTFCKLIDIIKSAQSYVSDGMFAGWNIILILTLAGVVILLISGSKIVLFLLGICEMWYVYGDVYNFWTSGGRFLFIYVVATLVLILLTDISEMSVVYEPKEGEHKTYKSYKRIWYFIYILLTALWAIHARMKMDSLNWTVMEKIINTLWSKWIWITVLLFAIMFISYQIGELKDAGEQKMPMLNDMYNAMCLTMTYLLTGFMVKTYTTLNIPILLVFIIYTMVIRPRKIAFSTTSTLEGGVYYKYCEQFLSAIALFVSGIVIIYMFSKGLYLNAVVTIILLLSFYKMLKAWRTKNELDKCNMLLLREFIKQTQLNTRNLSFWIKGIVIVSLEVIAYEASRCFTADNFIEYVNVGVPDYKILIVYAIIVAFTLLTYAILYKRNPMGCRPSVMKCAVVFLAFCMTSAVLMTSSNRALDAKYDIQDGTYTVSVERRDDVDYELSIDFGNWAPTLERKNSENGKYDVYEIPVDIDTDWKDMEHVTISIDNTDGTSSLYEDWTPAMLMHMYAGDIKVGSR